MICVVELETNQKKCFSAFLCTRHLKRVSPFLKLHYSVLACIGKEIRFLPYELTLFKTAKFQNSNSWVKPNGAQPKTQFNSFQAGINQHINKSLFDMLNFHFPTI